MDDFSLLIDLHIDGERQGPGSNEQTKCAISLAGLSGTERLIIVDMGCGTGASTLVLAKELNAAITAVDFLPEFLERLDEKAEKKDVAHKITTLAMPMEEASFADSSVDVIWSEGAIYNIGFEKGIRDWYRYLKPGGILAVSELTWLSETRPEEISRHWHNEYPEVAKASEKIAHLERNGYTPLGYFILPDSCWMDSYYTPMQQRFASFLDKHNFSKEAKEIVASEEREISLYQRYKEFVSYGFYIARKNKQ